MPRLVDAEAVVDRLLKTCVTDDVYGMGIQIGVDRAIDVVNKAATIDPESLRQHGRWEKSEDDYCGLALFK